MSAAAASASFFTPERMLKCGVALIFDALKFVFALFFVFAPLIIGFAAGAYVQGKCEGVIGAGRICSATGETVGTIVTATGYFAELTGVGAVAVEGAGEALSDAVDFLAWLTFMAWFMLSGVKFSGTKRSTNRFFITMTSSVIGVIPFINIIPTTTMGVVGVEFQSWLEQKEKSNEFLAKDAQRAQRFEAERQARIRQQRLMLQQRAEAEQQELLRQELADAGADDDSDALDEQLWQQHLAQRQEELRAAKGKKKEREGKQFDPQFTPARPV